MKQSKRFMALILALVMVISMIPVSVFAAEVPTFSISSVNGNPGDEVEVKVSISNNPGVMVMNYEIVYDTTRLEKVEFTGYGMDGGEWTTSETTNKVLWDKSADSSFNGDIMTLKFKIKADAPVGDAAVSIKDFDIVNEDDNEIVPNLVAGKVTVVAKPVTGISLDQTKLTLDQGATATLTATVEPADAGDKTVTWTSSNEAVATVANGVVTAVGAGSANITAKAGDFSATCEVTVAGANVPVTGITLDKSNFYLWSTDTYIMEGHSATMIANVTPDYATDKTVTWTSSDESVATIDANGVVNALKPGSVTITATAGEVSATCVITVIDLVFTATADDEPVDIRYTGSSGTKPTSQCDYRIEIPAGTKTLKLSGPMTTDWSIPSALKDTLADGTMTIDLSTYGRSGDHWEITMVAKNGYYWGTCHVISIYMTPCEGDHTFADATCTAPATCTVCYATQGEALGHDWAETTAKVEPDCVNPGAEAIETCQREGCGATQGGKAIAALGHTWKSTGINPAPTCTETGTESFICIRTADCDGSKTETVAALGHSWNEGSVTTEPTCTEKGVKSFICLVDGCGGTKTEEVPANGHNYVDGYCSVCEKMEPTEIPFTDANHTSNGNAFNQYLAGVDCLVVDGIAISDWTEWTGSMNKSITIYVDPVYKNAPVTISLKAKDGYKGTLGLFASPVTVNLSEGVGEYLARSNRIGIANFGCFVYFKLGECTGEHTWIDATCTEPKTCSVCGKTEGEALGHTWGDNSICTVDGCGAANVITEIQVSHPNMKNNTLTMATGTSEQIDATAMIVDSSVASTQMIVWSSSAPEVATVENGKITALTAGTTTITAKAVDANGIALLADGEEVLAQFTLTVKDPDAGYTITMGADVENTVIGSTVSIPVTIGHTDSNVTGYNAFDLTFEYDPSILELTSTTIEGMTVTAKDGKIHVERYGTALTTGETALTLTFKAIANGKTYVNVTNAKVDISNNALTQDAPDASFIDDVTIVTVAGYTVNLPEEFTGDSAVMPGEDYTFTAKDKNYDYTFEGTTMDGEDVDVIDNEDGTFTIESVSGNIVIKTEKTGKKFDVTLGDDMEGEDEAQYTVQYVATLNKVEGYNYNVTVEIGGVKYTGFTYDDATGTITIPGEAITGEIVFNSNKTEKTKDQHSVEFSGAYGDIADGTALEVENGKDYVLTLNKVVGYQYTVTATMDGEEVEVTDNGDGTYTIKNVTGDLKITITKEFVMEVATSEYVKLDGKAMFLVTAKATLDTGKVLSYNGVPMYYSEQYGAWTYLVIIGKGETLTEEDAKEQITLVDGEKVVLSQTYNVNETANNTVDINDAQLVFDMYNAKYQEFTADAAMQKFLKADVNGDGKVDVNDAVAIVAQIVAAK